MKEQHINIRVDTRTRGFKKLKKAMDEAAISAENLNKQLRAIVALFQEFGSYAKQSGHYE
ncbi:hypothetical protein KSL82_08845 [Limosilactobacillus portuensis]|uniref:Phage protein n=1 Tax=Limosilactobacillus portuensis TaxID=2742601 RepID=A0ABS6IXZ6_9LACO|nr:hypothetical protein [Limosilactobacillus portuensis]MBU9695987.1 hypothetical protein [Limosilactobacillus portuensis]